MTARAGGAALRREVRAARRTLTPGQRAAADQRIIGTIRRLHAFRAARRIAMFFAFDGEPDLQLLLRTNPSRQYFVPVITRTEMAFARVRPDTVLTPNFYGIDEPARPELIDPRSLDLVLTPLVAFDDVGTRVGVGAGYYDRCFAFLRQRRVWYKPKLVGIAYELQRIDLIEANPWDVPLWGAVTEKGFRQFRVNRE